MLQPTQYNAVLGGQSQQPKVYDVVIGGKQSIEQALQALKNPNTYEQAKKVLMSRSNNTYRNLDLKKFKSAKDASKYMRSIVYFGKEVLGETGWHVNDYEKGRVKIWFSTPSYKRVGFEYFLDSNDPREDEGCHVQLHNFRRRVMKQSDDWREPNELVCRIEFKDLQFILSELPNAYDFSFVNGHWGTLEEPTEDPFRGDLKNRVSARIGHYWDNRNSKMILLP
jgi:hypothetical protein